MKNKEQDKREDSISISKIDSEKLDKSFKKFEDLEKRIFSYSNWIITVSLGLLGFYIAFLLQLKSDGLLDNFFSHKRIIIITAIPISIGILIRIIKEVKEYFSTFKNFRKNMIIWIDSVMNEYEKEDLLKDNETINRIKNIKDKLESKKKPKDFYPAFAVYLQFVAFIYALIYIINNLYNFLFK